MYDIWYVASSENQGGRSFLYRIGLVGWMYLHPNFDVHIQICDVPYIT